MMNGFTDVEDFNAAAQDGAFWACFYDALMTP
jgi:hypothetical protein